MKDKPSIPANIIPGFEEAWLESQRVQRQAEDRVADEARVERLRRDGGKDWDDYLRGKT